MADPVTNVVTEKIVDSLFSKAKQEIDYVRNCTKNVEELRDEVKKLKEMRGRIQQRIDLAKKNGEALLDGVQNWMDKADIEISKVEEFFEEEANAKKTCLVCVSLETLHRYSKMAAIEKTPVFLKQQLEGKTFDEKGVSIPTPTPGLVDLYQTKNLDDIDTHKLALGKIIEALTDETIQIVGIYGSGGVGKTTLAKEAAVKVKKNDLFAEVVFITVSQTVDVKEIQKNAEVPAKRIIYNKEKVLIIIDDIWEKIDLHDVGIPCGKDRMNCKILLTSRSMDVCQGMNVDRIISVNTLTKKEAWVLFKRTVGERLENEVGLAKFARAVTEECGGLPLIIEVMGNTLKNKPIHIWEAALGRLQNHAPLEIAPQIRKAYTHLKLSYDLLESKEAKSCFLLCSLFKEDDDIDMQRLAEYAWGLRLFDNLDSIKDARKRVQIAVDTLTSSGLLLSHEEHKDKERVKVTVHKMHDVVRDVALLITSSSSKGEGEEKFLVKAGKDLAKWQPSNRTSDMSYTKISLMDNYIHKLPADHHLHFPLLDTFLIQRNSLWCIPDEFCGSIKEVKVLDVSLNYIGRLPQSMKLLTKLMALDLSGNRYLKEISIVGELKDLEILKVRDTGIEVVPEEIGQLTNLRVLYADQCRDLSDVRPGVISKLTCLEELYIGTSNHSHAVSRLGLMELSNLESLTALHFYMCLDDDCELFPEGTNFAKLPELFFQFNSQMGLSLERSESDLKRRLHIARSNFPFKMPFKKLFQVSDGILLASIKDLDNIIPDLYGGSIDELKCIELYSCDNVSCLLKTRDADVTQTFVTSTYDLIGQKKTTKEKFFSQVEEIHLQFLHNLKLLFDCSSYQYISLRNLQHIHISDCDCLLTVFPLSVAQGLSSMRRINISYCKSLMVVISAGDEQTEDSETEVGIHHDDAIINFPSLTHIHLKQLPQLKSFYSGDSTINYPSLEFIGVEDCPSMKKWGYGVHDIPPNLKSWDEETLKVFNK